MADNYLATRRDTDSAQTRALSAMSSDLRGEIDRVASSHETLSKQIAEQKTQITALQDTLAVLQTQNLTHTRQLEWITGDINTIRVWVKFGTVTMVMLLAALLALTIVTLRSH